MERGGCVYIVTNKNDTFLYTGVTSDLLSRIIQHREKHFPNSFSAKYNTVKLVYYEQFRDIETAIEREKQIKAGSRKKKLNMLKSINPDWNDLYDEIKDW